MEETKNMMAVYKEIEDFLGDIKDEKMFDKPIFINLIHNQNANGLVTAEIIIQYISKDQQIWTYIFDNLPSVQLQNLEIYDALLTKEQAEVAKKQYNDNLESVNAEHVKKYDELVEGFKSIGFKTFKKIIINPSELRKL